jgi:HPr kinase/phosphorylase
VESLYSVKLSKLVENYHLDVLRKGKDYEKRVIRTEEVSRLGLQLVGFFDYFDPKRLQVLGKVEHTFLEGQTPEERREIFDRLFSYDISALIITRGMEPFPECMEMAEKYDRTLLRSQERTTAFMGTLITDLRDYFSPRITRHGVLVEIYGEGVLILGESGVGKSETAIELIKRGHRLIADDAVEIKRLGKDHLVGSAPELIRYYMELRGIGVVDVRRLFGMAAVKDSANIDLVVNLEPWRESAVYDRLGLEELNTDILDVQVPSVTIPVKPGRNLAVIIEVAAMNNRHKKMGYNAAQDFTDQINRHFDEAMAQQGEDGEKDKDYGKQ